MIGTIYEDCCSLIRDGIYGLGINGLESERWFLSATSSFFIDFSFFSTTMRIVYCMWFLVNGCNSSYTFIRCNFHFCWHKLDFHTFFIFKVPFFIGDEQKTPTLCAVFVSCTTSFVVTEGNFWIFIVIHLSSSFFCCCCSACCFVVATPLVL